MPTKQIICISLIANSSEELKIELMMDLQIFTYIMNINFIDEYVDILDIYEMVAQDNVLRNTTQPFRDQGDRVVCCF